MLEYHFVKILSNYLYDNYAWFVWLRFNGLLTYISNYYFAHRIVLLEQIVLVA